MLHATVHHPLFVPIPSHKVGGAIVVNIFVILSMLALVSAAVRAVWLLVRQHLLLAAPQKREHIFLINTHFGQYAACLLFAMMLSTASGMIGIVWLAQRGITEGWLCSFQATLMHISTCSGAFFTVTIALHAFCSLALRLRQYVTQCRLTMIFGWSFAISVGLIPFMIPISDGPVYGASGLTCGVRMVYPKTQFFLHLLPIMIGSLLSAILYSLTFLALRGTLRFRGGIKLTLNPNIRWNYCEENSLLVRVARSMLWYPVAYIALLVPYAVVSLLHMSEFHVSFEVIVFAYVCLFSFSVVIVPLIYNTFHILSSVLPPPSSANNKSMGFLSRRFENFGYLSSHTPSTSSNEKIGQYRGFDSLSSPQGLTETSSKSSVLHPSLLRQDQSLPTPLSPPAFDYNHIITPPPSALLSSHLDIGRHDRKNTSLLAAGIPDPPQTQFATTLPKPGQSLGIYVNFVPNSDRIVCD